MLAIGYARWTKEDQRNKIWNLIKTKNIIGTSTEWEEEKSTVRAFWIY